MVESAPQFTIVGEEPAAPAPRAAPQRDTALLMMALKGLSQRAVAAVADLFTLLTVASAFWVWVSVPSPNVLQIVHNSIYGLFVLAANWIVRRK